MLVTVFVSVATLFRTYLHELCFGITAVALMLAGPLINGCIRRLVKKMHWTFRYAAFILLCTAGYVSLAQLIYRNIITILSSCSNSVLVVAITGIYLTLAWIAKEQRAI